MSWKVMRRRTAWLFVKAGAWAGAFTVLYLTGVWRVMVLLVALLVQEANRFLVWLGAPTRMGAKAYWAQYWVYWAVAYVSLMVAFAAWWFLWYRHHRPHLRVDGLDEGRVVWVKGLRRGLAYEVWDARHVLGRWWSRFRGHRVRRSPRVMANGGTPSPAWPSPHAMPYGRSVSDGMIIYFSRPWRLRLERLVVPPGTPVRSTYWELRLPQGLLHNAPDPLAPGCRVLHYTRTPRSYSPYDPARPERELDRVLEDGRDNVVSATAANPEIVQADFSAGSLPFVRRREDA